MIKPGTCEDVVWGDGNWIFLDIGFSEKQRSTGFLYGDAEPRNMMYGEARSEIRKLAQESASPLNLVIEAPLSVCFDASGNPKGRSIERMGNQHRYWYVGAGCAVMTAALYLINDLRKLRVSHPVILIEGFVSFKDNHEASDHARDVRLLREVVRDPKKYDSSLVLPKVSDSSGDVLQSAFCVAGIDCGIPLVIMPESEALSPPLA